MLLELLEGLDPVHLSLAAGLITTSLNALGATPVLFVREMPAKLMDIGLGFAAGVMMAASFTSLIIPGVDRGGLAPVAAGVLLGSYVVSIADKVVPHMHRVIGFEGRGAERLKAVWLFVIAVALHNMPEGLAVGVSAGSGRIGDTIALALAIGVQNIPEGLSIAFSILSVEGRSRLRAFTISLLSGIVELPLAIIGAIGVSLAEPLLPLAMGFAAGAMIFVVRDEMIPETHRLGHERRASYGLMGGLVTMLVLDMLLS